MILCKLPYSVPLCDNARLHLWLLATSIRNLRIVLLLQVASGQYYRIVTATFMHAGLLHLASNSLALWYIGLEAEAVYGCVLPNHVLGTTE